MSDKFRVALSGDFRKADGSPTFPDFDLKPLQSAPGVEMAYVDAANPNCAYMWFEHQLSTNLQSDLSVWLGANPSVPAACTRTLPGAERRAGRIGPPTRSGARAGCATAPGSWSGVTVRP